MRLEGYPYDRQAGPAVRADARGGDAIAPYPPHWDRFVAARRGDTLVQTAAWVCSKRRLGFKTRSVVLREDGAIVGGASLIIKRFGPLGGLGYIARGPLLARLDRALAARLVDKVEAVARAARVLHLVVQPPEGDELLDAELEARGYIAHAPLPAPPATVRLDLVGGLDGILSRMSRFKRSAIRRSRVDLREGERDALPTFHALHVRSAARQGFSPLSLDYVHHKWDCLAPSGLLGLVIAHVDDEPLAGLLLSSFNGRVTARLVGWTGDHPRRHPNVACDWWAIRLASEQGMRHYDIGGIDRWIANLASPPVRLCRWARGSGCRLQAGFGGTPMLFPQARQRSLHRVARPLVELAKRALQRSRRLRQLAHRVRNG